MTAQVAPNARCTACKAVLDGATGVTTPDSVPKPGDVTVCAYCGNVMTFLTDLTLRTMTPADLAELDPGDAADLRRAQSTVRHLALDRGRRP